MCDDARPPGLPHSHGPRRRRRHCLRSLCPLLLLALAAAAGYAAHTLLLAPAPALAAIEAQIERGLAAAAAAPAAAAAAAAALVSEAVPETVTVGLAEVMSPLLQYAKSYSQQMLLLDSRSPPHLSLAHSVLGGTVTAQVQSVSASVSNAVALTVDELLGAVAAALTAAVTVLMPDMVTVASAAHSHSARSHLSFSDSSSSSSSMLHKSPHSLPAPAPAFLPCSLTDSDTDREQSDRDLDGDGVAASAGPGIASVLAAVSRRARGNLASNGGYCDPALPDSGAHGQSASCYGRDLTDSIGGRPLPADSLLQPPVDVVYTWVNGSDPDLRAAIALWREREIASGALVQVGLELFGCFSRI